MFPKFAGVSCFNHELTINLSHRFMNNTDFLSGTVKGRGRLPPEYLFIVKDSNRRPRVGESPL